MNNDAKKGFSELFRLEQDVYMCTQGPITYKYTYEIYSVLVDKRIQQDV